MQLLSSLLSHDGLVHDRIYTQSLGIELLVDVLQEMDLESTEGFVLDSTIDRLLHMLRELQSGSSATSLEEDLLDNLGDFFCLLSSSSYYRPILVRLNCVHMLVDMLRSEKHSLAAAGLKMLNHCLADNREACNCFVEVLGLKPLGAILTGRVSFSKKKQDLLRSIEEHTMSIANSLLKNCTDEFLVRASSKFIELDLEKLVCVMRVFNTCSERMGSQTPISAEKGSDEEKYLSRCERGLFTLQQASLVILRVFNNSDDLIKGRILVALTAEKVPMQELMFTVHEYIDLLNAERSQDEIARLRTFLSNLQTLAF